MTIVGVKERAPFAAIAAQTPGLAGPSMVGTIAWRNAMQLGYGVNALLDDHTTMTAVAGQTFGSCWATFLAVGALFGLVGVYRTAKHGRQGLELAMSVVMLSSYAGVCAAVIFGVIAGTAPNGFAPFWWPAALAGQVWWRIRAILREQAAVEQQRERERAAS